MMGVEKLLGRRVQNSWDNNRCMGEKKSPEQDPPIKIAPKEEILKRITVERVMKL